jgi:hypothetical protein
MVLGNVGAHGYNADRPLSHATPFYFDRDTLRSKQPCRAYGVTPYRAESCSAL